MKPRRSLSAALLLAFAAPVSPAQTPSGPPVLWPVSSGGNGSYYQVYVAPGGISWSAARAFVLQLGGGRHLATITSAAENAFVYSLVAGAPVWTTVAGTGTFGPWLGGLVTPCGWGWVTAEPFAYVNWAPGEPNNACPGQVEDRVHFGNAGPGPSPTWNNLPDAGCLVLARPTGFVVEQEGFVYDNGPIVTGHFNGFGCANTSLLQTGPPTFGTIFGYGAQATVPNRVADDFHVNGPTGMVITEVEVFAYQTGSTTTSTFTGLFLDITAGNPSLGAAPVPGSPGSPSTCSQAAVRSTTTGQLSTEPPTPRRRTTFAR